MKKNFARVIVRHYARDVIETRFEFAHGYGRAIFRTTPEIRANTNDAADPELRAYGVKVRGRRNEHALSGRNDPRNSKQIGKSWKDFTKNKKQWQAKGQIKDEGGKSQKYYPAPWPLVVL